jgi:hypothetical protein
MEISGYGIRVDLPAGWEGRLYKRLEGDPTLHAGTFPLPPEDGDFGGLAISSMAGDAAFLVLTEYDRELAGRGLFAPSGHPTALSETDLDPRALQRTRPGLLGVQRFFTEGARAFCLYVVVGSRPSPGAVLAKANEVLRTLSIGPTVG